MKLLNERSNYLAIAVSTIAFVILFYQSSNNQGLNWFLYLFLVSLLAFLHLRKTEGSQAVLTILIPIIAGIGMFWHGTALAITACIISLLFLTARLADHKLNFPEGVIVGGINMALSPLVSLIRIIQASSGMPKAPNRRMLRWFIPVAVLTTFGVLYYHSSPVFKNIIDSFEWPDLGEIIFMTAWGGITSITLFKAFFPKQFSNKLRSASTGKSWAIFNEDYARTWQITVVLLSVLLGFVILSDAYYRIIVNTLPPDLTLSEYLHQGFFSLIVSVLFSAFLGTMLLSRKSLHINSILKYAVLSFLVLNAIFIAQTCLRNVDYISEFGLTSKRIAVFFYLVICMSAVILSSWAVKSKQRVGFLYSNLSWVVAILLVSASLINWSKVIMKHNLAHVPASTGVVDFDYLLTLNRSSLPQLLAHKDQLSGKQVRKLRRRLKRNLRREQWQLEDPRGIVIDHYMMYHEIQEHMDFLYPGESNSAQSGE